MKHATGEVITYLQALKIPTGAFYPFLISETQLAQQGVAVDGRRPVYKLKITKLTAALSEA